MRRFWLLVLLGALAAGAVAMLAGGSAAAPAGRWVVHDLGASVAYGSGDGTLLVTPRDVAINERGQVAGWTEVDGRSRAVLWQNGRLKHLGVLPGHFESRAVDVNERGQVVGVSWKRGTIPAQTGRAFLWDDGRLRDLGLIPGWTAGEPIGINGRGQVAGATRRGALEYGISRAVLWERARARNLGTLPGGDSSETAAINERGQIVGSSSIADSDRPFAFLWQGGKMRSLGTLPGSIGSFAVDLNEHGQVVGELLDEGGYGDPFFWEKGKMRRIRVPTPDIWEPVAINERGQVAVEGLNEWVVWQGGKIRSRGRGTPTALNDRGQLTIADWEDTAPLVAASGKTTRLPLLRGDEGGAAIAINERDQIVGISGTLHRSERFAGWAWECRLVLWTWERA